MGVKAVRLYSWNGPDAELQPCISREQVMLMMARVERAFRARGMLVFGGGAYRVRGVGNLPALVVAGIARGGLSFREDLFF